MARIWCSKGKRRRWIKKGAPKKVSKEESKKGDKGEKDEQNIRDVFGLPPKKGADLVVDINYSEGDNVDLEILSFIDGATEEDEDEDEDDGGHPMASSSAATSSNTVDPGS